MRLTGVLALLCLVSASPASATPNLSSALRVPYYGGTELAYDGRYVYAGQFNGRTDRDQLPRQGGVRIVDTSVTPPRHVGTIGCPGTDMDVAVVRPGLVALGYHRSGCGVKGNGVTLFDVTTPSKPRKLGSVGVVRAHTITPVPGTPYLYASPGGLRNGNGVTSVIDTTNPSKPRVVRTFAADVWGCHDVTFVKTPLRTLGTCAGGAGVRIWDMASPTNPRQLAFIENPDIQFAHGTAISDDGGLLVVNDEAFYFHTCGDPDGVDGALHVYDILRPEEPRYLGRISPPRGRAPYAYFFSDVDSWCTSHQLNFAPASRRLVNAWYTGGDSVYDLTVPGEPREVAWYQPSNAIAWTGHWFGGRVWVNDMNRGLEALDFSEVPVLPPVARTWTPADRIVPGRGTPRPASAQLLCRF